MSTTATKESRRPDRQTLQITFLQSIDRLIQAAEEARRNRELLAAAMESSAEASR